MLMKVNCEPVVSLKLELLFDDGSVKKCLLEEGDLVDIEYNRNGLRKRIEGKVIRICTTGAVRPEDYYIIVDGSEDFVATQARICPMKILDCVVIFKANEGITIQTPKNETGIPFLRISSENVLQYSRDGINWLDVSLKKEDTEIKDEEGTTTTTPPSEDTTTENEILDETVS